MALHLVTFGNKSTRRSVSFFENAKSIQTKALNAGFDHAHAWSADVYTGTDFEARNGALLKEPRGAGYWVWKPWIIRRALDKIGDDDVLIYSDAGKLPLNIEISKTTLLARLAKMQPEGFIAGMQFTSGRNDHWTKRDAFILMDADEQKYRETDQIQVGWSAWTKSDACFKLLDDWQHYAEDRRICSDDENVLGYPNYDGFQENRHDQSIYTNLVFRHNLPFLNFSRRPARRFVIEVRKQPQVSLRKFWGGEQVLAKLETHFAGSDDPLRAIEKHAVRRFSDL
jgi:hypothetical protein